MAGKSLQGTHDHQKSSVHWQKAKKHRRKKASQGEEGEAAKLDKGAWEVLHRMVKAVREVRKVLSGGGVARR